MSRGSAALSEGTARSPIQPAPLWPFFTRCTSCLIPTPLLLRPQDPALQYRALLTYIKRVYHPFLLREPQVGIGSNFFLHTMGR